MSEKVQKIREEIERLYKHYLDAQEFDSGYNMALDTVLQFIDSLPEEHASNEEIEALNEVRHLNPGLDSLYWKLKKS